VLAAAAAVGFGELRGALQGNGTADNEERGGREQGKSGREEGKAERGAPHTEENTHHHRRAG